MQTNVRRDKSFNFHRKGILYLRFFSRHSRYGSYPTEVCKATSLLVTKFVIMLETVEVGDRFEMFVTHLRIHLHMQ